LTTKTAITKRIEAQLDAAASARDVLAGDPDAAVKREALQGMAGGQALRAPMPIFLKARATERRLPFS